MFCLFYKTISKKKKEEEKKRKRKEEEEEEGEEKREISQVVFCLWHHIQRHLLSGSLILGDDQIWTFHCKNLYQTHILISSFITCA